MATVAPPFEFAPISYDPQSTEAIPNDIKGAIDTYLGIVRDYLSTHGFPLMSLEISSFVLPGEEHRYWIVTHWLDTSADPALDYWAEIDTEIEEKASLLPAEICTLLAEDISTSVRWKVE